MKNTSKKRTIAGVLCLGLLMQTPTYLPANADNGTQVSINEVCSKNTTYKTSDGNCYDWIELYNSGKTEIDISGWGLSDKAEKPYKFAFPDGTHIAAGGRLLVYCDSDAAKNDTKIAPFGLSTDGETLTLTDKSGNTAQTITFEAIPADTSYGQYPDGSGEFYMLKCTPDKANTAPEGSASVHKPSFSHDSGFYDSEFKLTLTADEGCDIYYTTDGSDPVYGSKKYTEPLSIKDMTETENRLHAIILSSRSNFTLLLRGITAFLPHISSERTVRLLRPKRFQKRQPELGRWLHRWLLDDSPFTVLFGMQTLQRYYLKTAHLPEYLDILCCADLTNPMLQKAAQAVFCAAVVKNPAKAEPFFRAHAAHPLVQAGLQLALTHEALGAQKRERIAALLEAAPTETQNDK